MSLDLEKEEKPIKTKFYYGWVILVMSALAFFFSGSGQTYSISIFIDHYIKEFGWSRSLVFSLYSGDWRSSWSSCYSTLNPLL